MATASDRFMKKVNKTKSCWLWFGAKGSHGYGAFWFRDKVWGAHRVSYVLYYGDFNFDFLVCHTCDNPLCVNPEHLWLGTDLDNCKDRDAKKRGCIPAPDKGETHHNAIFTDKEVYQIKKLRGRGQSLKQIASVFDCSIAYVSLVSRGLLR